MAQQESRETCINLREETFDIPVISIVKVQDERGLWDENKNILHTRVVNMYNISPVRALIYSDRTYEQNIPVELSFKLPERKNWETHMTKVADVAKGPKEGEHAVTLDFMPAEAAETVHESIPTSPGAMLPGDIDFLLKTHLIGSMPEESMPALINRFTPRDIETNERFIIQGEAGDALYLIQHGTCSVMIEKDGDKVKLARLCKGDVVGEMALFTGEPRSTHVVADTEMRLWCLAKNDFDNLIKQFPELRYFLTEIVTQRLDASSCTADRRIDKYIIKNKLGKGGWSIVYQGVHHKLNMPVAIKMMRHDMAMEEEFQDTFKLEAEIIARLNHKNIVKVYDVQELFRTIFIIMEYLDGVALKEHLKQQGPLPVKETVNILMEVLSGLDYAHINGIIHRDIKPANIFLENSGLVKILDFGLACAPGTEDMNMKGTVNYMPPEQIDGDAVSAMADIYSLGIMAYEMLAGERPYPEDDLIALMDMHCDEDIPDPAEKIPGIMPDLSEFIIKCCARDPEKRYQSAESALEHLQGLSAQLDIKQTAVEPRRMTSLFAFYDEDRKNILTSLLEEFCDKAQQAGIDTRITEFKDV